MVQVAVALVLVVSAGLLVRTVRHLAGTSLGYRTESIHTVQVVLPAERYTDPASQVAFEQAALERMHALPGVESATASIGVPVIGGGRVGFIVRGRPETERHEVAFFAVAPNFMGMMRLPVRVGRDLGPEDRPGAPRALLINEMTARQVWPEGDAVGQRIHFGAQAPPGDTGWVTVAGIVADVRQHGPTQAVLPTAYGSTHQFLSPARRFTFAAAEGAPPPSAPVLRALFHDLESGAAMGELTTLDALIAERTAPQRLVMLVLLTLGFVATTLCAFGLFAVVNLTSSMRVREYAIRMAVGAEPSRVRWLVLRQAVMLCLLGAGAGLAAALFGTRALRGFLHGVEPLDAVTFAFAVALVLLLSVVAAWLPAARSGRVAAAQVLKS